MNLFDLRFNEEKKHYETLIAINNGEQVWEPAATWWVKYRIPFFHDVSVSQYSLLEMLLMEGWTPPKV